MEFCFHLYGISRSPLNPETVANKEIFDPRNQVYNQVYNQDLSIKGKQKSSKWDISSFMFRPTDRFSRYLTFSFFGLNKGFTSFKADLKVCRTKTYASNVRPQLTSDCDQGLMRLLGELFCRNALRPYLLGKYKALCGLMILNRAIQRDKTDSHIMLDTDEPGKPSLFC